MAERDVTRNGRGQIVSYEIDGVSDSSQDTLQYGKVFLPTFENGATKVEKLNRDQLTNFIDVNITDELLEPDRSVDPSVLLNEEIRISDFEAGDDNAQGDDDEGPDGQSG